MRAYIVVAGILLGAALAPAPVVVDDGGGFEKTYPLLTSDTASVDEVLKVLVGRNGTVVMDRLAHKVTVRANAEQHRQVAEIMAEFNRPPRNVQVQVWFRGSFAERETGVGVKKPKVTVKPGGMTATFEPELKFRRTDGATDNMQSLLIGSGREGLLMVGEEVPFWDWLVQYGIRQGAIVGNVEWKYVGARLRVKPTIIGAGPLVLVQITPEISDLADPKTRTIRFASATTEITATDGQPVQLGGWGANKEFYEKYLVGRDASGNMQHLVITLVVRIMPAADAGR